MLEKWRSAYIFKMKKTKIDENDRRGVRTKTLKINKRKSSENVKYRYYVV